MESSQCPGRNAQTVDLRNPVIKLEKYKKKNTSTALKNSDISSESDESDAEIDVENNTILTDAEIDNNNNTFNETMDAPEDDTGYDSNTVHDFFRLNKQIRDKILAKRLMVRRKFVSRSSLNQSSLLDYFSKSNLPFKRAMSVPKTPTSGYFTRSKNSSFRVKDERATLNLANSTLMSDTSAVNITTNSIAPEVPVNEKTPKLKDYIFKYCLKCNKTFKNDERVKYCGRCRLMLKYKCGLCKGIYGTLTSAHGHLSKHSKQKYSKLYSTVNDSVIDTTSGMENSLSNEEAALDDTASGKHYNHICIKCNQTYESTKKCKECQIQCLMRCMYCDKTYNTVSGIIRHVRQVHNAYLPRNESANASAIDTSQNIENMSRSRKRKMTNNVSEADIVKDSEDFSSSRKRKIDNDGSMIDTSNNVTNVSSSRKGIIVNNNKKVTVTKNVTKDDKSIIYSNRQYTAYKVTKGNEVEELDVKTYMFLNCLTCDLSIQKHDGNIIPCTICNVNMVLKCYLCNDYVNIADEVKNHIRIHVANDEDYINCFKCLKSIPKAYITTHLPFCKTEVEFSCKFCYFKTRNDSCLIHHAFKQHAKYINLNKCNVFKAFDDADIEKQRKNLNSELRSLKRKSKNTASYFTGVKGRINRRGTTYQCEVCPYSSKFSNNLSRHIIHKHLNDSGCNVIKFINETYNANLDGTTATEQQHYYHSNEVKKATHSEFGDALAVNSTISTSKKESKGKTRTSESTSFIYLYCPSCKKLKKQYNTRRDTKTCENCKCAMQYKCIKCEKLYNHYSSIVYHMNSKCSIQRLYNCARCEYTTPVRYQMHRHVKIHNNSILAEKIEPYPSISGQPTDEQSAEIQTPVDNQNDGTSSKATLRKSKTCPKCKSRITVESYHDQFCGKEPTIFCNFCPFKTKYRSNFFAHYKAFHLPGRKVNVSSNNLKNNVTTNEDVKNTSQPLKLQISSAETDKYIEEYCVNCCGIPQTSVMKPMWKCKKCKINLLFRCTKCNVMYPKRELLVRHVKRHLCNAYKCTNCSKCFGILENLKKHEIICKSRITN